MPSLTPEQIDDLVMLTLPLYKKYKWTDLSLEYPEYISSTLITEKNVIEMGGPLIKFFLKVKNTGTARISGMFQPDQTKVDDVMVSATVPWSMLTVNYSYDIYEDMFQSDRETLIRLLTVRDHDAMSDMAELQEECLWTAPSSPTDTRPMGIPFWLQKDATTAPDGGFHGGNPSGFSAGRAGLSSVDYPRWRNWTFGYTTVTSDDLVKKVKKSLVFTDFRPPVPHPELGYGKSDYQIFTTYRVQEQLERLAETRNDNLGKDVARYMGQVTIGGTPVRMVHYLENNDTSDPIYGVNWKVFRPFVKKGCNMRRHPPKTSARMHTVKEVHIDHWMNYVCYNLRNCFVGSLSS